MNEEFGGSGYSQYIDDHKTELARHVANIEIDNGSGHPVGYTAYANSALLDALSPMIPILNQMSSVVQVARWPLGDLDEYMPGFEPRTDMRNYYDYHPTAADTFDKINPQGLRENSALLAVLSYMIVNLDRTPPLLDPNEDACRLAGQVDSFRFACALKPLSIGVFLQVA